MYEFNEILIISDTISVFWEAPKFT